MIEQLTYAQIAERLGITAEAARALVKRHRLPRARSNDGNKVLVAIDLTEIQHKPLPARSPRGQSTEDVVATLTARIAELEAELAQSEERSRGHRADYEHERDRADHLVTAHDRLVAELETMRSLQLGALRSLVQSAETQQARQDQLLQAVQAVTTPDRLVKGLGEVCTLLRQASQPPPAPAPVVRPVTRRTPGWLTRGFRAAFFPTVRVG